MAHARRPAEAPQLRRLVEELGEAGLDLSGSQPWHELAVHELDYARRPRVHERRVPSYGAFIAPTVAGWAWGEATDLSIERRAMGDRPTEVSRFFADGMSSWLIRHVGREDELAVFDRPSGSERDLVVLAEALGGTVVQRHPSGLVRVAGGFGVLRWDGIGWHLEPRVTTWLDAVGVAEGDDRKVIATLLAFAVHDLGSRGIGATLVYRSGTDGRGSFQAPMPAPPPLRITRPVDLAPLRHVLSQLDGATLFDADGTLAEVGVRLVPSSEAEADVAGFRGMRHTSARRYSADDPLATVIVVSEDGPVTVLRGGRRVGESAPIADADGDIADPLS